MRTLASLIVLAMLLPACGYKGPLYLPGSKPAAKQAPAPEEPQRDRKPPDA